MRVALRVRYDTPAGPIELGDGVSFDGDGDDVVIVSFDPAGEAQWARQFDDVSIDHFSGCGDGVVLTLEDAAGLELGAGPLSDEGALVVLDGDGELRWVRSGDYGFSTNDAHCNAAGELAIAGVLDAPTDFGGGEINPSFDQGFVARYGAAGEFVWARTFDTTEVNSWAGGVRLTDDGEVIVIGGFAGPIGFAGLDPVQLQDVVVARYDAAGEALWATQFGPSLSTQSGRAVGLDPSGRIIVGGSFLTDIDIGGTTHPNTNPSAERRTATYDAFVASMSPDGAVDWSTTSGISDGDEDVAAVGGDESGRVIVAYTGPATVVVYDGQTEVWSWSANFGDNTSHVHAAISTAGEVVYGPWIEREALELGGGLLEPHGSSDLVLTKLAP